MGSLKGIETLKKGEFQKVYRYGKAYHSPYFVIFYLNHSSLKVGFVASKKVGKAVARNRAKRRLKALLISQTQKLKNGYYVFVAKPRILEAKFKTLEMLFQKSLEKIAYG